MYDEGGIGDDEISPAMFRAPRAFANSSPPVVKNSTSKKGKHDQPVE